MHASCRCCQPTKLPPLLAVEHLLSISSAMVVRCWFTGEARDIKQNLRPCIRHHSSNYMESASSESQNSYLHSTVFPCSKDSSVHSWVLTDLVAHPGASDSLFSLMNYGAVYKLNDWLIHWLSSLHLTVCDTGLCCVEIYYYRVFVVWRLIGQWRGLSPSSSASVHSTRHLLTSLLSHCHTLTRYDGRFCFSEVLQLKKIWEIFKTNEIFLHSRVACYWWILSSTCILDFVYDLTDFIVNQLTLNQLTLSLISYNY